MRHHSAAERWRTLSAISCGTGAAHAGVSRGRLLVRIEAVSVGFVFARAIVRQLIKLKALIAHLVLVDRRRITGEDRIPVAVLVIDRDVPLRNRHLGAHGYDEAV